MGPSRLGRARSLAKSLLRPRAHDEEHLWSGIDEFLQARAFPAGIHTIPLRHGGRAQILVIGDLASVRPGRRIPVAFNAAVGDRAGTQPPFFSGRRLFAEVKTAGLAVSDPIFDVDPDISVGWYTGLPGWHYQEQLAEILAHIGAVTGRELLTLGGSAGGFAALGAASRLGASAFVWNPQICILWYHKRIIWRWMEIAFPDTWYLGDGNWKFVRKRFMEPTELDFDLGLKPLPARMLYLQNDVDWHVRLHVTHYVSRHGLVHEAPGLFVKGDEHALRLAHFGDGPGGHVKPPRDVLLAGLEGMLEGSLTARQVHDSLGFPDAGRAPDLSRLPARLVPEGFRPADPPAAQ